MIPAVGTPIEVLIRLGGRWEPATVHAVHHLPSGIVIEAQLADRPLTRYAGLVHESERRAFCWRLPQ